MILVIVVAIIILIIYFTRRIEPFVARTNPSDESIAIEAVPLQYDVPQVEVDDVSARPTQITEVAPVTLTFDAANARAACKRSRDKRVFDAIANRTVEYYRPFYEEEMQRCEMRDWWDDVSYPINDSGEYTITPNTSYGDPGVGLH